MKVIEIFRLKKLLRFPLKRHGGGEENTFGGLEAGVFSAV